MKKGFTLIELLAVIIILSIVAFISTPIVLNVIDDARKSAGESEANLIMNSIISYCEQEKLGFSKTDYCKNGLTIDELKEIVNPGKVDLNNVKVNYFNDKLINLSIESNGFNYEYKDGKMNLGLEKSTIKPNEPNLLDTLTPIRYDGSKWVYADLSSEWYNYDNKEWANAVVLSESGKSKTVGQEIKEEDIDLWYVWIPRYKYQLFDANNKNSEIQIEFEYKTSITGTVKCEDLPKEELAKAGGPSEKCINDDIGNWYTHPAFTFGDKELEGMWVGKFEVSDPTNPDSNKLNNQTGKITIKPNVKSLRNQDIATFSKIIQNMSTKLNGDSHMVKNMEWGAVAYLSQSRYGLCTNGKCVNLRRNNNSNYITGYGAVNEATKGYQQSFTSENEVGIDSKITQPYNTSFGVKASTTQNIYGVYDMSGGSWEYVMGCIVNDKGEFLKLNSGFLEIPKNEYYDLYAFDTINSSFKRGKLGDATKETSRWQHDYPYLPIDNRSWIRRSGNYEDGIYSGLFYSNYYTGIFNQSYSTHSVLVDYQ